MTLLYIALYFKVFHSIAWYLLVLHCIIIDFGDWAVSRNTPIILLRGIVCYCKALYDIAWYCIVEYGISGILL